MNGINFSEKPISVCRGKRTAFDVYDAQYFHMVCIWMERTKAENMENLTTYMRQASNNDNSTNGEHSNNNNNNNCMYKLWLWHAGWYFCVTTRRALDKNDVRLWFVTISWFLIKDVHHSIDNYEIHGAMMAYTVCVFFVCLCTAMSVSINFSTRLRLFRYGSLLFELKELLI